MEVSPVFVKNYEAFQNPLYRIIVNEGGTRSGKTYSILQNLIVDSFNRRGWIYDIVRKTQVELRDTVLPDFVEILKSLGIYDSRFHNKTSNEFWIKGNLFRFIGIDKAGKKKGSKRNVLYINEATGLTLEDWVQLVIRTTDKIVIDYNPSEYFWVNDHILEKRTDFCMIKSNYLDNYDFLPAHQIAEIENLINVDDYYYQVYTLGNLTAMKGKIYKQYTFVDPYVYDNVDADEIFYGIDWGYDHAQVLLEVKYAQEQVYERELYFEKMKYDTDLIKFMLEKDMSFTADMYADPAYPASIKKMKEAGFSVRKAKKDIYDGIRFCQSLKRNICKSSVNYQRQINRYKWKQTASGDVIAGEPVKVDDDLPDAMRYAEYTHMRRLIGGYDVGTGYADRSEYE